MESSSAPPATEAWSLSRLPNYDEARTVTTVRAADLTRKTFTDAVRIGQPFKITGAVSHWPAFQRWRDTAYLLQRVGGDTRVRMRDAPQVELLGLILGDIAQAEIERELGSRDERVVSFAEFVASFDAHPKPPVQYLYAMPLEGASPFSALGPDVTGYHFVEPVNRHRFYPMWRVFLGRGYTDWHYHPAQEALMAQVVGTKRVALLSPSWADWAKMKRVARRCMYRYDVNLQRYPEFATIEPLVVTVEPGDALFIPVYWWHCVESLTDALGSTVALSFDAEVGKTWSVRTPASLCTARAALAALTLGQLAGEARRVATSVLRR